jgi:predicted nuclease of predicted toxin-antitoxin system
MQFLADEDFPMPSVRLIRQAGYDVAAIVEDAPATPDRGVLARAVREGRYLLTFDRDYGELIYRHRLPAPLGVIYFRTIQWLPEEPAARLLPLLQADPTKFYGAFVIIGRGRGQVRYRPLPASGRNGGDPMRSST